MSKTWKDRLITIVINISIMVVAGLIIAASQAKFDDEMSIKEKVHEHDVTLKEHEVKIENVKQNFDDKFDLLLEEIRLNRSEIRDISK